MSSKILKYEELNHVELSALSREKTLFIIACSPLEEHGVHLPYGVDLFIAKFFGEEICSRIAKNKEDWSFVMIPPLFIGADPLKFFGSIPISPIVIKETIYSIAKKIAQDGFRKIMVISGHGGPRHIVALEEVAAKISWRYPNTKMMSATGRLISDVIFGKLVDKFEKKMQSLGKTVDPDFLQSMKTDYHAGFIETSVMMVARPDLVKDSYKDLKPNIIDKPWKVVGNVATKTGAGFGHLGTPSLASKEIGELAVEVVMEEIVPKVDRFLDGDKAAARELRSFFYYIPIYRTHFKLIFIWVMSFILIFGGMAYFTQMMAQMMGNVR